MGVKYDLPDEVMTLADGTHEIVLDYDDGDMKAIAAAGLPTLKGIHLATVIVAA